LPREHPNHGYWTVQALSEQTFRLSSVPDAANDSFAYVTNEIIEGSFFFLASKEFAS
jgi:hypothetical protein